MSYPSSLLDQVRHFFRRHPETPPDPAQTSRPARIENRVRIQNPDGRANSTKVLVVDDDGQEHEIQDRVTAVSVDLDVKDVIGTAQVTTIMPAIDYTGRANIQGGDPDLRRQEVHSIQITVPAVENEHGVPVPAIVNLTDQAGRAIAVGAWDQRDNPSTYTLTIPAGLPEDPFDLVIQMGRRDAQALEDLAEIYGASSDDVDHLIETHLRSIAAAAKAEADTAEQLQSLAQRLPFLHGWNGLAMRRNLAQGDVDLTEPEEGESVLAKYLAAIRKEALLARAEKRNFDGRNCRPDGWTKIGEDQAGAKFFVREVAHSGEDRRFTKADTPDSLAELKAYAAERGQDWTNPIAQAAFVAEQHRKDQG